MSTSSNYTEPTYKILQEPETGHPEFLVLEVHMPNQVRSRYFIQINNNPARLPRDIENAECNYVEIFISCL